ncbi:MAG: NAD(P)-dependent oxidoreductase [Phycisphaeraceae bacterium]|nr:MAG: NAD(P)-dependent oxidoreductase [Phycisphaeraceae bacterium]
MRTLVTGGSGFIGRYFHDVLTSRGDDVVILDLVTPTWNTGNARFVRGDVRDPEAVASALTGCSRVLHLAAAHHDFGIEHDTYFDVNERGSRVVCDAMDAAGVTEACFYSSVAVYGDVPEPRHEDSPCKPVNPYGASKLAGEKVFRAWVDKGAGRRCLVIRPTITFGPRNFANMYSLIRQVHSRKFVQVGPGRNIKSLSYVENIVAFTMHAWQRQGRAALETYNWVEKPDMDSATIASTIARSLGRRGVGVRIPMWLALLGALPFDLVIALTGKNLPISSMRIRKFAGMQTKFESDRARALGFSPAVSLAEGIDRMVRWFLAEGRHEQPVWHTPPAQVQKFSDQGPAVRAHDASAPAAVA